MIRFGVWAVTGGGVRHLTKFDRVTREHSALCHYVRRAIDRDELVWPDDDFDPAPPCKACLKRLTWEAEHLNEQVAQIHADLEFWGLR